MNSNYDSVVLDWQPVIGLEVHVQLSTNTKMFSACEWGYGNSPNTLTCPLTMAYPGTLPVINKKAVENAIIIGKTLNCKINNYSEFSRKHYFYPDLPKGYQISQYDKPICGAGYLEIKDKLGVHKVNITRAHLEEDAGKLLHDEEGGGSLVDYNRSGAPLIEIVTEPDFREPQLVDRFLKTLKNYIEYAGVSDCNMEKGNLRVDLNVSIMKKGASKFGIRREIKNLNSFRSINRAIRYEVEEQAKILESGGSIKQSTMIWNENENRTRVTREKEDAHDYRYFPDPDLPPLYISDSKINQILEKMPEMPDQLVVRFKELYNLKDEDLLFLVSDKNIVSYFEDTLKYVDAPALVLNWIRVNIMEIINKDKINISEFSISPDRLAELLKLFNEKKITKESTNEIFKSMLSTDQSAFDIMKELNLEVLTNQSDLNGIVQETVQKFPNELDRLRNGEDKLIKFFMGQVMKETKGKYPPNMIIQILKEIK